MEETARKVQQEVEAIGETASVHVGNYKSWEDCQSLMEFSKDTYGRIDSLIVIVGGSIWGAPYQALSPEQISLTVDKNFWPTM